VQSLEADLKEEVYQPIEKWHTRYREVKVRHLPRRAHAESVPDASASTVE
jgi:hypothetical protein